MSHLNQIMALRILSIFFKSWTYYQCRVDKSQRQENICQIKLEYADSFSNMATVCSHLRIAIQMDALRHLTLYW